MNAPTFSPRLLIAVAVLAVSTFAMSLYFLSQERRGINDIGPTSYSKAALGYAALAELLPKLGIPFSRREEAPSPKPADELLILAEPLLERNQDEIFNLLVSSGRVLVILPKWYGRRSTARRDWLDGAELYSSTEPQRVLKHLLDKTRLRRLANQERWPKADLDRALDDSPDTLRVLKVDNWTKNDLGINPVIKSHPQLIVSANVEPIIASNEGILLGSIRVSANHKLWVLSDPDVLSNHGLGPDGKRNAAFALALIDKLRNGGKTIFDETIHGYITQGAAKWRFIFKFPYVIGTIQAVLIVALLLWAGIGRFGAPDPETPALTAGKHGLIENVARLMAFAGYQKHVVRRYVEATIQNTARQLHAPKGLPLQETVVWTVRIGEARGVNIRPEEVLARADLLISAGGHGLTSAASVALDIYRWREELLNGPSVHPRDH